MTTWRALHERRVEEVLTLLCVAASWRMRALKHGAPKRWDTVGDSLRGCCPRCGAAAICTLPFGSEPGDSLAAKIDGDAVYTHCRRTSLLDKVIAWFLW